MTPDETDFFDAALSVVARYGMKRTTMADLARGVGLSRQTLYDRFGDKDGVMAAAITHMGTRMLAELSAAVDKAGSLSDKIELYYRIVIWPVYDMVQQMPDAADLEKGMGPASVAANDAICHRKRALLAETLAPHLGGDGPSSAEIAFFFEHTSSTAKSSAASRAELAQLLAVLKSAVLALAARA